MEKRWRCLKCGNTWVGEGGPSCFCYHCGHLYVKWLNFDEWWSDPEKSEVWRSVYG